MPACPRCGIVNPEGFRFCGACGMPLPTDATASEARKTVTILFMDVVGSTNLGERLDPESMRRVMSSFFDRMKASIERHGGTVEKFIGDAVMAVFGVPQLHEDDALRAVRAAADMRKGLAALNEELARDWGVILEARIGVNTGEVVAGDPSAGQRLVIGDAVNVAARLEQSAGSGEILVGEDTLRLVRDAVRVEPVAPLSLKGKSKPPPAYRLLDVVQGAPAHARRLDSPIVGREKERLLLEVAFGETIQDSTCRLVTVLGPAGVGKSRLVAEFVSTAEERASVLTGRCLHYGDGITFWPILEIVREAARVDAADSPGKALPKIAALLPEGQDSALIADHVAQAVGLSEGAADIQETFWAIRKLLESLAGRRPLVVVIDDIHWAEPTFLDLVQYLTGWSSEVPILLLCVGRPELLDVRSSWGTATPKAISITLEPLAREETHRLVRNLLGRAKLDERVQSRIDEVAEGNPLFVEEMLSMLIDERALQRDDGRWIPVGDITSLSLPPTIHALLAARLDSLEKEEREVVQRASVVGKVFWWGAVSHLSPEPMRAEVGAHLQTLVRKALISPDRSSFAGQDAFRFRHILTRDAAYQAIPKQVRAELHERFATWLQELAGEREREYEEILAYHLEEAYRYLEELAPLDARARALGRRAAERLITAGRRALARGDMPATVNLLSRANSLLEPDDHMRLDMLPYLGEALLETGELQAAKTLLASTVQHARDAGKAELEAHASLLRLELHLFTDEQTNAPGALAEAEKLIPVFEEVGDDVGLARAWRLIGLTNWLLCRAAASEEAVKRAVDHARRAGDERQEARNLGSLTSALVEGPTPAPEGIRRCEEILEAGRRNRVVEAAATVARSTLVAMQGSFDEAREGINLSRAMFDDLGLKVLAATTSQASALVELLAGEPSAAERELRGDYDVLEQMHERGYLSTAAALLARALYEEGRVDEADRFARISAEAASRDDIVTQAVWRGAQAKALSAKGLAEQGERLAVEAVELVRNTDFLNERANVLMDHAEVLRLAGRPEDSRPILEDARRLYEDKGNVVSAAKVRSLLDDPSLQTDAALRSARGASARPATR